MKKAAKKKVSKPRVTAASQIKELKGSIEWLYERMDAMDKDLTVILEDLQNAVREIIDGLEEIHEDAP